MAGRARKPAFKGPDQGRPGKAVLCQSGVAAGNANITKILQISPRTNRLARFARFFLPVKKACQPEKLWVFWRGFLGVLGCPWIDLPSVPLYNPKHWRKSHFSSDWRPGSGTEKLRTGE